MRGFFHFIVLILLIIILYEVSTIGEMTQGDFNYAVVNELRRINQKIRFLYKFHRIPLDSDEIIENMTNKLYNEQVKTDMDENEMIKEMIECYKYHKTQKQFEGFTPEFSRGEWTIQPDSDGKAKLVKLQEAIARSYVDTKYKDVYGEPPPKDAISYFVKGVVESGWDPNYTFELVSKKYGTKKTNRSNVGITDLNEKFTGRYFNGVKMGRNRNKIIDMSEGYRTPKSKFFPGWI